MKRRSSQAGFTLIEIVVAMALFALFMVATLGSLGALSKVYQHGIATRRAVDNSRLLIEDVARVARFASNASVGDDRANFPGPAFPVVSPAANVTCGPSLLLDTPTQTDQYEFDLDSQDFTGSNYVTVGSTKGANYLVNFVNNSLSSNQGSFVTQNDGTSIDIGKSNANGVSATYPGAYVFCVYNNPPNSYVKISFTINNATSISGPFLFFNTDASGKNQGINFTTTIGIGGAGS